MKTKILLFKLKLAIFGQRKLELIYAEFFYELCSNAKTTKYFEVLCILIKLQDACNDKFYRTLQVNNMIAEE